MENKRQPTQDEGTSITPEGVLSYSVKRLRQANDMSQEALAQLMVYRGHSWRQTTVAKTEAGSRPIRVNEAASLARIFGISVGDFLDEADRGSEARELLLFAESRVLGARKRVANQKRELQESISYLAELEKQLLHVRTVYGTSDPPDEEAASDGEG